MQVGSVHSLKTFVGKGAWSVGEFSTSYFSLPQQRTQRHTATHTQQEQSRHTRPALVQRTPRLLLPRRDELDGEDCDANVQRKKNSTRCSPGKGRWVQYMYRYRRTVASVNSLQRNV